MGRSSQPITVTLGDLHERVDARLRSGAYASASEVIRAALGSVLIWFKLGHYPALRALDREEAALDAWLRQRVDEAFTDPRPDLPADEVFKRLRAEDAKLAKAERDEEI